MKLSHPVSGSSQSNQVGDLTMSTLTADCICMVESTAWSKCCSAVPITLFASHASTPVTCAQPPILDSRYMLDDLQITVNKHVHKCHLCVSTASIAHLQLYFQPRSSFLSTLSNTLDDTASIQPRFGTLHSQRAQSSP
jgi:hypothetical protein